MCRDHAVGAVGSGAIFFDELVADVGVEFAIERLQLHPGAVEFGGELRGRHVVSRAPEFAGVLVAELTGPDVFKLDFAGVLVVHGSADGMPPDPEFLQLLGIARLRHDVGDIVDAHAGGGVRGGRRRAVFSFAVHAGELRSNGGLFGKQLGVFGSSRSVDLQQHHLAPEGDGKGEFVEAVRCRDQLERPRFDLLVDERIERFGVVRDVGLTDPVCALCPRRQRQQLGVRVVEKRLGFGDRGRTGRFLSEGEDGTGESESESERTKAHRPQVYRAVRGAG